MRYTVCPDCGEYIPVLSADKDELGWHTSCPKCKGSFDIDIEDYQMYVVDSDVLTLPHPRTLERDFVVKPLAELRPNFTFADGSSMAHAHPEYGSAVRIDR